MIIYLHTPDSFPSVPKLVSDLATIHPGLSYWKLQLTQLTIYQKTIETNFSSSRRWYSKKNLIIFYEVSFVIEIRVMFLLEQMGQAWILLLLFVLCLSADLKTVILHKQVSQTTNWQLMLPYTELWIGVLEGDIKECVFHIYDIYNNCRIRSYRLFWSTMANLVLMSIIAIDQNVTINYAPSSNALCAAGFEPTVSCIEQ
jgi:hypothetical protein